MGSNGEDSEAFDDFCPLNKKKEITRFDFLRYQKTRDVSIRDKIINHYAPFIEKTARTSYYELLPANGNPKYEPLFSIEDCKQAGYLAAIKCIDRYNPSNGASFEYFLYKRIRGEIIDESIKLCLLNRRTFAKLRNQKKRIPKKQSLYQVSINSEEKEITLKDTIRSEVNSYFDEIDEIDELFFILKGFSEREKKILIYYDFQELPMKKVGEKLDISESRVSQIYPNLLHRLQNKLKERQGFPLTNQ